MRRFDSKTALAVAAGVALLVPAVASAQPGGAPPNSTGYYAGSPTAAPFAQPYAQRRGLLLGFTGGLGAMVAESDARITSCFDCDYSPVALSGSFNIGGMLNPRLALLFEVWVHGQSVSFDGTEFVTQAMALAAAQYWLTERLWIKGGIGAAHLEYTFDNGRFIEDVPVDDGAGAMFAIGYDVLIARHFAMDVQLRIGAGSYEGIRDQITATTVDLGFSWF